VAVIGLVACAAEKLARPAPARELYCSPLFRKSLAYAEARCDRVYVLSAAHGLVELDAVTKPYDRRLGGKAERLAWGSRAARSLVTRHGREVDYLLLAGADYAEPIATGLRTHDGYGEGGWRGVAPERILQPLQGLQVGARLRRLNELLAEAG
jgi:hypothetical protein